MKRRTLEEVMKEILKNDLFVDANEKLPDEEKKKVDSIVRGFVQNFVLPLEDLVISAQSDPEIMKEIRSILENGDPSKKNDET